MSEKTDTSNPLLQFVQRYGPAAGEDGPVLFVTEVFGVTPDPWQEEVLRAFGRGERQISVASCHGPGKTALAAWCIWYMMLTRFPQKTIATAPSSGQLESGLLPEVKMWGTRLPAALQELFDVSAKRVVLTAAPDTSFFHARTARAEAPEALQGIHSDHVLLIADEASGVPEAVYEAAVGSMSGENATTLLISNPTRTSGTFFDSHHKNRSDWFTRKVSHEDSPRVTDEFVRGVARRYGEDSDVFRVRCLGLFPRIDADTIIPFEYVELARDRDIRELEAATQVWGLDVARFGGDRNVLIKRTNRQVLPGIQMWGGIDLMATAGKVKHEWDTTPPHLRPKTILIDVIGLGAGVADRLRELGLPVRGVNVSEAAAGEGFLNQRAELWWGIREWLGAKQCRLPGKTPGVDEDRDPVELLCSELVIPKYTFSSSGKIKLEAKEEMKKRMGRSPDVADALALTFAENLATLTHGTSDRHSWNEPLHREVGIV